MERRAPREVWAKRVERLVESGLTAAQFATESGINAGRLAFWKWRLDRERASARKQTGRPRGSGPVGFLEVRTPASAMPSETIECEPIEVVLRGDVRVRVPARFDATTLRRVIDSLEGR